MEALQGAHPQIPTPKFEPNTDQIKRNLTNKGVHPTPKIVHTLRKKQLQKHNRKLNRLNQQDPPLSESQSQALLEETHFQTLKAEYRGFTRAVRSNNELTVGMPWEGVERIGFRELASGGGEYGGEKLKREELKKLREMFETRKREEMKWVLEDDVEMNEEWFDEGSKVWDPAKRRRSEREVVEFLVERLSGTEFTMRDWKLSRMMKKSGLEFSEGQVLKVLNGLGAKKCWKQALAVVEWVYKDRGNKHCKSRFVYTKLLAILGKAGRPQEALNIFNMMRVDFHIYPDIAAYHSIAVTLGQTGRLKELLKVIECMRQKPVKINRNMFRNWDPILEPDVVVYNAILNACVQSHQWKSVYWVFNQLRYSGLKPNGATYGLAMEVMLQSGKYDLVHELFRKMKKSGEAPKALTYKVIVRALWCEGKVNEAIEAVRDMERRGVVGTSGVYYELACCLCKSGRWQDALLQVEKMKNVTNTKPLEVTFTGMIKSSMEGGHIDDCVSIFEQMKNHCSPNIGTINTMLKVFGRTDMFSKAKELFEETKAAKSDSDPSLEGGGSSLMPDEYTYTSMLKASASALQWEYFEYVYKEMALSGYQIDQSKNASILVEASRAGKGYLLEHAFDRTLEAGEIPHLLFFIEMVYQATARHDYKRAATLVNTMAYAPFQVSERQWTDVFKKNEEGISQDGLKKLLDALEHCDVTSEATLLNLKRSLQSLCRSYTSRDFSDSVAVSSLNDNDQILTAIAEGDSSDLKCVVRLIDHFKHAGPNGQHLCMVLEFLGDSLLRLIKYNRYKGLKLDNVREICKCILMGLDYLHREVGIIHTDLKPENILLFDTIDPTKDPIRSKVTPILERPEGGLNGGVTMSLIEKKLKRRARRAVAKISLRRESMGGGEAPKSERNMDGVGVRCKVVDFGNACWADKQLAEEIQTRQYRAPEVILRSGYTYSVDMWSFACTAFELATGDMLFAPKMGQGFSEDEDHLALMMELLGKMPRKVAIGGARSKDFFDRHGDLKRIRRLKFWPLNKILVDRYNFSETDAREFAEFLCPIFDFSPEKRPTAQQCLQHPWLNDVTTSQGDANNVSNVEKVNVGMSNLQIKVGK